jgi:hypothetical protein
MKTWRSGVIAPRILNLNTRRAWVVSFTSWTSQRRKSLGIHWRGGWVGPRVGVKAVGKRQISCPFLESNYVNYEHCYVCTGCFNSSFTSIYPSVCLSVFLCIYLFTVLLLNLGRFFSVLIHTQSVRLLERGISPSQGRYLHKEQHKHRINAYRYPCLEWDSNPRSQCSSGRKRFMP